MKKPNQIDTTLRNLRAEKRRFAELERRVHDLEERNFKFADRIQALEENQPRKVTSE